MTFMTNLEKNLIELDEVPHLTKTMGWLNFWSMVHSSNEVIA